MINVLVVDDSEVIQQFLVHLLSSDPDIQVVGVANSGLEALKMAEKKRPNVITMDVHMPVMDGYEATRAIMESFPTPIVIVSGSLQVKEMENSFKLIEAGALAVVVRPPGIGHPDYKTARDNLIKTVKLMSEVKVVRRFPGQSATRPKKTPNRPKAFVKTRDIQLVAIGASTGGPIILQAILSKIPKELSVPVLIVQHIAKGFTNGFRDWLALSSNIPLSVAVDGENLLPGNAYIAPENYQMGITRDLKIKLQKLPPENGMCPSVDFLFRSVTEMVGSKAIGVLLTGMGKDGAKELRNMKKNNAVTIVQDEASCIVFGMPGEAIKIGAADHILPPEKIVAALSDILSNG